MKIIAFGGSTSAQSINKKLATYVSSLFSGNDVEILDLNDFEVPLFSVDIEAKQGHPTAAKEFVEKIGSADLLIISLAEHNGSYTAAFKNLFDWCSRIESNTFQNKPMFLMATSPGARGGKGVLEAANTRFPFHAGNIVTTFSLPEFYKNFNEDDGITNPELKEELFNKISQIKKVVG